MQGISYNMNNNGNNNVGTPSQWFGTIGAFVALILVGCMTTGCSEQKPSAGSQSGPPTGRNVVLQQPFDQAAKLVLLNVGRAYEMSLVQGKPPGNKDDLGALLTTMRDGKKREIEVVYGVDPKRLGEEAVNYRLAWEKEPTNDGGRLVLMADGKTVKYLSQEEFDKTPKAK